MGTFFFLTTRTAHKEKARRAVRMRGQHGANPGNRGVARCKVKVRYTVHFFSCYRSGKLNEGGRGLSGRGEFVNKSVGGFPHSLPWPVIGSGGVPK